MQTPLRFVSRVWEQSPVVLYDALILVVIFWFFSKDKKNKFYFFSF